MILNKKYFALSALALLTTMFAACSDDDPSEVYVGDMPKYQKAYITTGVSYPNGTAFKGVISSGDLKFTEEGKLVFEGGMTISGNGSFDSDVYFRTNYAVKKAISGTVAEVPDPEEFLAQYNAEHRTECKLLPAGYYTIENGHATIEAGSKSAAIHVTVNTELEWKPGEYLLPLALTLDGGAGIALAEEQSTLCLKYTIAETSKYPEGCRLLTSDEFEVEADSSANAANAVDSDRSTVWGNDANEMMTVTFKEAHYLSSICIVDCSYYYFPYIAYEDDLDGLIGSGGYYFQGNASGMIEFSASQFDDYDSSRKTKRVAINNYYGTIADVYFLVYD